MAKAKLSLLDRIAAAEDVDEELMEVPEWNESILFRGMSLAAMQVVKEIDLEAAKSGDLEQMVKILQATATDPETKQLIFASERGGDILRVRNGEVLLRLVNKGALKVLGVDEEETAGKGSSSTETEAPATA